MLTRETIATLIVGFILASGLTLASPNQPGQQLPESILNDCEGNVSALSNTHHLAGADTTIIAIARLGTGEQSRDLNRRRLHNIRVYLTELAWHRDPLTVVTAEGERVKGYGRVELYVRGILFVSLAVRRNEDLMVGSCTGSERTLYPYRRRSHRRK